MPQRYQNDSKNPQPGKLFIGERPYEPLFAPIRATTADGLQTTQLAPSHTPDDGHNNERSNPLSLLFPRRGSAPYPSSCSPKPTTRHPVASRKTVASAERKRVSRQVADTLSQTQPDPPHVSSPNRNRRPESRNGIRRIRLLSIDSDGSSPAISRNTDESFSMSSFYRKNSAPHRFRTKKSEARTVRGHDTSRPTDRKGRYTAGDSAAPAYPLYNKSVPHRIPKPPGRSRSIPNPLRKPSRSLRSSIPSPNRANPDTCNRKTTIRQPLSASLRSRPFHEGVRNRACPRHAWPAGKNSSWSAPKPRRTTTTKRVRTNVS